MKYDFVPMTIEYAERMKDWTFDGVVKKIYVEPYFKGQDETGKIKGPGGCDGFAVLHQNSLVGLFEYYFNNEIMEIGLALSPDVVGKGFGKDFVIQGLSFGVKNFTYKSEFIKLNVHIDNKPAIRVYEKVGFKQHKKENDQIEMRIYL